MSCTNRKEIEIIVYTDERILFHYNDSATVEDACTFVAQKLDIRPIHLPLFGLMSKDYKTWWPMTKRISLLNTCQENQIFYFRCRFKVSTRHLKNDHSDFQSFLNYIFLQCRSDLLSRRLESIYNADISPEKWNGLAVLDLVCKARKEGLSTSDISLKDIQQTFHEETTKKISTVFSRMIGLMIKNRTLDEIYKYLRENEERDKNTPLSEIWYRYICCIYDICGQYCNENYKVHIHIDGNLREKTMSYPSYDKKKTNYIGSINNLFTVMMTKYEKFWKVEIHRERGHMLELFFDEYVMAESFVSLLVSYYRLTVNFYYSLCLNLEPPSLSTLNKRRCHGPITNRLAEKLLEPRKGDSFVLHRSTEHSDHLIVTVYNKEEERFKNYQILWLADDRVTWFCDEIQADEATKYRSVAEMLADVPALASVKNIIKPSPTDHNELLLCRDEAGLTSPHADHHNNCASLLSRSDVTRKHTIGMGHYTTVCDGHIFGDKKIVAIKYIRPFDNRHLVVEALQESVNLLREVTSPYMTRLLGVCLVPPFMAALDYCHYGSILQCFDQQLIQFHHLVDATHHLSKALMDLESMNLVHGGIMCRNVLVDKLDRDVVVKLADPGMVHLYKNLAVDHVFNQARLPWLSPELRDDLIHITEASDVYSFGSTVWEMFSYGAIPPIHPHKEQLMATSLLVTDDDSLPLRTYKTAMTDLIHSCWDIDPSSRPSPKQLCQKTYEFSFPLRSDNGYSDDCIDILGAKLTVQLPPLKDSANLHCGTNFYSQFPITEPPNIEGFMRKRRSVTDDLFDSFNDSIRIPGAGSMGHEPFAETDTERPVWAGTCGVEGQSSGDRHTSSICQMILDREDVREKELIGKGFYGEVYKGVLIVGAVKACAIKKVLREDLSGRGSKSLEDEGMLMTRLQHDNIVQFYGMCLRTNSKNGNKPLMLVMEYMKNGALSTLLRSKNKSLTETQRLSIASDIARGMEYLSRMKVIHRDLAARNILLDDSLVAKISDFGLAKLLHEKDYYRVTQENPNVPAMWYPPEFFMEGKSTSEGDVWSYGITMWEMYSPGEKPKLKNAENTSPTILAALQRGDRLECPELCAHDDFMYTDVMMVCWSAIPHDRPSFSEIVDILRKYRETKVFSEA